MEKILEKMNDLSEEGWEVVKEFGSAFANVIVFLVMVPLFVIGWLKRLLTKPAPDASPSGSQSDKL